MAEFSKSVLVPGSYVIIFLQFYAYHEWYSDFHKVVYDVISYPYVIMFDFDSIQNRNKSLFPESSILFALIAYLTGGKRIAYNSNLNTRFHLVNRTNSRNLAEMYDVQQTKTKLCLPGTKVPLHLRELPVDMLADLVDIFTPQGGAVVE